MIDLLIHWPTRLRLLRGTGTTRDPTWELSPSPCPGRVPMEMELSSSKLGPAAAGTAGVTTKWSGLCAAITIRTTTSDESTSKQNGFGCGGWHRRLGPRCINMHDWQLPYALPRQLL
jgi:hypothetical protein